MKPICSKTFALVLLLFYLRYGEAGWKGGGKSPSRPSSYPSYKPATSRPYYPAATSRPATYRPATFRPATYASHAPTYRPSQTMKPFPSHAPTYRPATSKPFPSHAPTYRPSATSKPFPSHAPTYRPSVTNKPYPTHKPTYGPVGPPVTSRPFGQPSGPARPGYYQPQWQNPSHSGNYQKQVYVPSASGNTKVKIKVKNYYNPGYHAPPSYPMYHYSYRDTGSTTLGFFLGYSLARITSPSYYHTQSYYGGYSPRYDHYTVHHYYHNSNSVPQTTVVQPNNVQVCGGDSALICPSGTQALCTTGGQIMCVSVATNTAPCQDNPSVRCVKSNIPCANNEAAECKNRNGQGSVQVDIPCVSTAQVYGNVTYVNNTVVIDTPQNSTNLYQSDQPMNTTVPLTTLPPRQKRAVPQDFCVTVLAVPSERKQTEGEQAFEDLENVVSNFAVKALNV